MVPYEQFDHKRLPSALGATEEYGAILTFSMAATTLEGVKGENMKEPEGAQGIQAEGPLPSGAPLPLRSPHHRLMRSATSFSYPWSEGS